MNPAMIILARGAERETFLRHLPFWQAHGIPMFIVSPADDPLYVDGLTTVLRGRSGHVGPQVIEKYWAIYSWMLTTPYDGFWIFEFDAVCLSPNLPTIAQLFPDGGAPTIAGPVFNTRPEPVDVGFAGKFFIHHPYFVSREVAKWLKYAFPDYPASMEKCCWDRYLGLICGDLGITPGNLRELGIAYSQNTIDGGFVREAEIAAANGVSLFHGVKDAEILRRIISARETRIPV